MPRSKKTKRNTEEKVVKNYSGVITEIEAALASAQTLKEFIYDEQYIPEHLLTDSEIIRVYSDRLRLARKGKFQNTTYTQVHMSLKKVGGILGISAVMVAAKEGANAKKPLLKIDRDDLLLFCYLYQVSPHYLLGMADRPDEYVIPKENLIENPYKHEIADGCPTRMTEPTFAGKVAAPLYFPPPRVERCSKLILYKLRQDQKLLEMLIQLTRASTQVQKRILSRFEGSVGIRSCHLEEYLDIVETAEFGQDWIELVSSQTDRNKLREWMNILAEAGMKNFDILEFVAKVSVCDSKTRKMVQLTLEDDEFH